MQIEHISVSRKGCFDLCPCQYKFKYHMKLESDRDEEPWYFTYGKIVHKVAEEWVKRGGQSTIEEVSAEVFSGKIVIEEGYEDKPPIYAPKLPSEYAKKYPDHLRAIKDLTLKTGFSGYVEYHFLYDLDPPNGRNIKGFIDRIIEKDGKFWIIDYKTSKKNRWRKNRFTIAKDLQLRAYAKVIQREFNVPAENISAALYYLEGSELIGCKFSQNSLDEAERDLLETYKSIEKMHENDAWGNVGDHCQRCDFVKVCPFYRMT